MQSTSTLDTAYTYDPLSRLTAADYDNGVYFHYTYDPAGNRLTQTSSINQGNPDVYVYDSANRLTSVNGQEYTWDNNGNLLDDGVYSYAYDRANRLAVVRGPEVSATYAYNGLGERMQQTVDVQTTDFIVDQAGGLTQVLSDGADSYLYGLRRIAEQDAEGWQYYVGDALGSVRQLVDDSGEVRLAKGYEPYGSVLSSEGEVESRYGFTGEWTESDIELIYLRARYYAPVTGRFTQIDPSRIERNLFLYANANPVNITDPSGLFSSAQIASSMGYSSFEAMLMSLATIPSLPFLESSRFAKWGFFSALLDAKDGDDLRAGSLILMTTRPHVQYRAKERLWLLGCDQIMVGSRTLEDYFDHVLIQPTYRDLAAEYWRDTSPRYYNLSGNNTVSRLYIDGSNLTDLPDFHSIDVGFWNSGKNFSGVVDRFGNKYLVFGLGRGIGGGTFYSEGYICASSRTCIGDNLKPFPIPSNENAIKETIQGVCYGVSAIVDGGMSFVVCVNSQQSAALIYSFGIGLSGSVNFGYGTFVGKDEKMGWNWALKDRFGGISYTDVMIKGHSR